MGWPECILIGLLSGEVAIHLAKHGEPRGNYNVFLRLFDAALLVGVLYWGGFFA
jgi:hypothetical protein